MAYNNNYHLSELSDKLLEVIAYDKKVDWKSVLKLRFHVY